MGHAVKRRRSSARQQLFNDLIEGAVDILDGDGIEVGIGADPGHKKRNALVHSVKSFSKLMSMKDSYRAEYEREEERRQREKEYIGDREKGEETEDDLNATIAQMKTERDQERKLAEMRDNLLTQAFVSVMTDPDRAKDPAGMSEALKAIKELCDETGHDRPEWVRLMENYAER